MPETSGYSEMPQPVTIADGIRLAAARTPDKVAVRLGDHQLTYTALANRIREAALAATSDSTLAPGDHAAIVSRNRIEYIEITCGLPEASIPVATISPRLAATEIKAICDDAKAKVLFVDSEAAETVAKLDFVTVERIIEFGDAYEEWIASGQGNSELPDVDETDVWTIPYTSGTTGAPKGVLIPHRSRVLTFAGAAEEYGCFTAVDRFLAFAPMNHGAGIVFALAPLFFGGFVELLDHFDPELVLQRLKAGKFTGVFMVPTHFHGIFSLDPEILDANRPTSLRTIISNAAPLPQPTKKKIVEYFGEGLLHETYGSTEGGIVSNLRPEDQLRKTKCVGKRFPHTSLKIINVDGDPCGPGEVGELYSKSPYLFDGYWGKRDETDLALRDGWLTVGDLAMQDDEGYLYIVDRKKDMVISGGINIYPREIEEALLAHPDISDVAVIGVPDEKWGEQLKAYFVCPSADIPDDELLEKFLGANLARYKIPREFERLDAIPRNAAGKIVKDVLRARQG